jgi:hypothetical protein
VGIPDHLRRYPTWAAIDALAARFGFVNEPGMQDWAWEVADPSRIDEFLAAYEDGDLSDDERFTLMDTMLQSFEDLPGQLHDDPPMVATTGDSGQERRAARPYTLVLVGARLRRFSMIAGASPRFCDPSSSATGECWRAGRELAN